MSKPTKICFISLGSYPLFNPMSKRTFGGSEVQLYLLAKHISKGTEFDVHFIVGNYGQDRVEIYDNIKVYRGIPLKKSKLITQFLPRSKILLFKLMRKINANIYIQRSASAGTGLICFIAHIMRKRFVYMTAHEIDCNGRFEKQNNWLIGKLFKYGIRHADLIITQNKEHQEMIRQYHKRESIVMNSLYEIPKENEFNQITKDIILWVGRCEDWKRPEVFIDLARKFPQEKFVMIAPRSNNQSLYYDKIKSILKSVPNLQHIEYVPFTEIDMYFQHAKVFVQTSIYEGFPNTFVQAAKNKTPILSLKVNPDGFLEKYNCGYCVVDNLHKLEEKLKELLGNDDLRQRLGENAYIYARGNHDIEKITKIYENLFSIL